MALPPSSHVGPELAIQALRGRVAQLESELTAATTVTHTITFVGSCVGWQTWKGGIGTSQPHIGNAAPTAHLNATLEYAKWKTANPEARIISEDYTWHGLESHLWTLSTGDVWMAPTRTIIVKYRDP